MEARTRYYRFLPHHNVYTDQTKYDKFIYFATFKFHVVGGGDDALVFLVFPHHIHPPVHIP
jgi:hypothetical protein